MKRIIEVILAVLIVVITSVFLPFPLWTVLLGVVQGLNDLGANISIIGNPQGIDPGALILAILFLLFWLLMVWLSFRLGKRHLSYTFSISAPLSAVVVFVIVSSLAWF